MRVMSIHCIMSGQCLLAIVMNIGKTKKYPYKGGCIGDDAGKLLEL